MCGREREREGEKVAERKRERERERGRDIESVCERETAPGAGLVGSREEARRGEAGSSLPERISIAVDDLQFLEGHVTKCAPHKALKLIT